MNVLKKVLVGGETIDDVVKSIYSSSRDLKTTYSNLKKNNKSEEK